jgi:hypothetical protein
MSKKLNVSVLVAARDEYIDQLKCIIVPLILQGFNSIYQDAITISRNNKVIYKFQELLKQIPQWNQTILQEESKRIKKKCPYIMDIVTAIFVTNVKILASVRLKGSKEDIRVKIPTSDIFIHSIYIEAAQQIFYDPFLFYHRNANQNYGKIQDNKHHVKQIINYSIEETIRQMLPFDDILQKYLADALKNNAEFGEGESESEESVSDSDEQSISDGDLPSDEESLDDPDENKIKSFNLGDDQESPKQEFMFNKSPESEQGDNDSEDSEPDEDNQFQPPVSQFQPPPVSPNYQFIPQPSAQPPPPPAQEPYQAPFQSPPIHVPQQPPVQAPQQPPVQGQERFSFFS